MRYFTADTHYGHARIIEFCGRPYAEVSEMNADLVMRASTIMSGGDELWHLGDVALGEREQNLAYLAAIPAEVTLVAGNHDHCHPSNGDRAERYVELYRRLCGLRKLYPENAKLELASAMVVQVSHFPYADPETNGLEDRHGRLVSDKFAKWRPIDDDSWLLCGHVHEMWRQRGRMINVGVDAWGGDPVSEEAILALIAAGTQDLPALDWQRH